MAFHKISIEKPRVSKKFLTARNVEDMAAAGATEIIHAPDLVITDAARETAIDLNIKIINPTLLINRESKSQSSVSVQQSSFKAIENSLHSTGKTIKLNPGAFEVPGAISNVRNENVFCSLGTKDEALIQELVDLIRQNWQPKFKSNKQLIIPA